MNIAQEIYESIQELYQEIIKVDLKTGKATILHSITVPSDRGKDPRGDPEHYRRRKKQYKDLRQCRDRHRAAGRQRLLRPLKTGGCLSLPGKIRRKRPLVRREGRTGEYIKKRPRAAGKAALGRFCGALQIIASGSIPEASDSYGWTGSSSGTGIGAAAHIPSGPHHRNSISPSAHSHGCKVPARNPEGSWRAALPSRRSFQNA